ncbi:MAG: carbamoyl-phosphate synthase domain-containing protein, partial [Dehalococcoidia bacterium]|nr:carbamoyl-phosphate synthase domain-containing protein [Dehalococcoidia bacterium]
MDKAAILALEDGSIYHGYCFGAEIDTFGEVVFCTSMVGYQEMLTDPSYAGQILVPTYPLIGNYGINEIDIESAKIQVQGFVVREQCLKPSHYQSRETVHQYLTGSSVPGIYGVDTRAVTRRLRSSGVMMGTITSSKTPRQALEALRNLPNYGSIDFVRQVTAGAAYRRQSDGGASQYHIVALDCGLKYNILRMLNRLGCDTT